MRFDLAWGRFFQGFLVFIALSATIRAADRVGTLRFSLEIGVDGEATPAEYRVIESAGPMASDSAGNLYVAFQRRLCQGPGAGVCRTGLFPIKLDPQGERLYSAYVGELGDLYAGVAGVAVDKEGNVYVAGTTDSSAFPATNSAFQRTSPPGVNGFITKLDPSGTRVLFSTWLGGGGEDTISGLAVDGSGNVYVCGETGSNDFPVTPGALETAAKRIVIDLLHIPWGHGRGTG